MDDAILAHCEGIYHRTHALWTSLEGRFPTWKCRYSILYGPPSHRPELLILGANPGYNPDDLYDDEILKWPPENEYIAKDWPLAQRLRRLFSAANCGDLLEASLGTNLLFFKSRAIGHHESGLGWLDNPPHIRFQLESHCRQELNALIGILEPKAILILGLSVFDGFILDDVKPFLSPSGRRVATSGKTKGIPAIGIIHPTGARTTNADWTLIARYIAKTFSHDTRGDVAPVATYTPTSAVVSSDNTEKKPPLLPATVIRAATKPPASFGYQPIHDFWRELAKVGPVTVEAFHAHMKSIGWIRPRGGELTYEVTRIDLASMCKHGFAERVQGQSTEP